MALIAAPLMGHGSSSANRKDQQVKHARRSSAVPSNNCVCCSSKRQQQQQVQHHHRPRSHSQAHTNIIKKKRADKNVWEKYMDDRHDRLRYAEHPRQKRSISQPEIPEDVIQHFIAARNNKLIQTARGRLGSSTNSGDQRSPPCSSPPASPPPSCGSKSFVGFGSHRQRPRPHSSFVIKSSEPNVAEIASPHFHQVHNPIIAGKQQQQEYRKHRKSFGSISPFKIKKSKLCSLPRCKSPRRQSPQPRPPGQHQSKQKNVRKRSNSESFAAATTALRPPSFFMKTPVLAEEEPTTSAQMVDDQISASVDKGHDGRRSMEDRRTNPIRKLFRRLKM